MLFIPPPSSASMQGHLADVIKIVISPRAKEEEQGRPHLPPPNFFFNSLFSGKYVCMYVSSHTFLHFVLVAFRSPQTIFTYSFIYQRNRDNNIYYYILSSLLSKIMRFQIRYEFIVHVISCYFLAYFLHPFLFIYGTPPYFLQNLHICRR